MITHEEFVSCHKRRRIPVILLPFLVSGLFNDQSCTFSLHVAVSGDGYKSLLCSCSSYIIHICNPIHHRVTPELGQYDSSSFTEPTTCFNKATDHDDTSSKHYLHGLSSLLTMQETKKAVQKLVLS